MISIKKSAACLALIGAILFGGAFTGDVLSPISSISFEPITVSAASNEFKVDGLTYEIVNDMGVAVIGCDPKTTVSIPNTVMYSGKSYQVQQILWTAFSDNTVVSHIDIPTYVIYVDVNTFNGCTNLKTITVSRYNKSYLGYDGVIYNKNMTELIKYPPQKIGSYFHIPSTVNRVHPYSFDGCRYLEKIIISRNATDIYESAFDNCKKLKEIEVDSRNNYFCSENGALYTKDKTMLIKYPGALINDSFTIAKEVTYISDKAFSEALNLSNIYVESGSNSMKVSDGVLFNYDKTRLILYPAAKTGTSYYIPNTVTYLSQNAFLNSKITDIWNLDRRIKLFSETNFITNSSINSINGSTSFTSENSSFLVENCVALQYSSFVINAIKARVNEAQKYLNDNYQVFKSKYPNASDDFIKVLAMHNWLCDNTQYVPTAKEAYGIDINRPEDIPSQEVQNNYKYSDYIEVGVAWDNITNTYFADSIGCARYHRASGAFLMPFTVCEGYAKAYQILLESVSVECEVVGNSYHDWNVVYLDGKYYSVDCCHDDNGTNGYNYSHFLKTNDYLMQNCQWHNNPKVKNHNVQLDLIFNVLGQNHNIVTNDYIEANTSDSNYDW